ncbi:MAG: rhomboid family intramembrane serine protease [Deferribacterota bacterium]|nr:rhomboid family intramembrane serine protease [Deferribacterota bacterium]
MFPLKDSIPAERFPYVNYIIILINLFIFIYQLSLGAKLSYFLLEYGFIPSRFFAPFDIVSLKEKIVPLFTSIFLHGNLFHVLSNMYFLFIFGDNVEGRFGHFQYLLFYIFFGVIALIIQAILFPDVSIPTIGASGAVAGVMGAYFIIFPYAYIKTLLIIIIYITVVDIPAVVFLGFWFFIQFINGSLQQMANIEGGIAWWAHIGGFIFGIFVGIYYLNKYKSRN